MQITPEEFDIVVIGTGFQESLIASSAALVGKTVLHLDSAVLYGDLWSGMNLQEFQEELQQRSEAPESNGDTQRRPVFSHVAKIITDEEEFQKSRDYLIDLAPKLTYASGPLLSLLLKSQSHHYVDYRYLDACFVWREESLLKVPSSRSDIFKDRILSPVDKRSMTGFLKSAIEVFENQPYSELDFDTWLKSHGLNERLMDMIQSAVCFCDTNVNSLSRFQALGLYLQSSGRFKPGTGPFISPYYSSSDVPQAFCRLCAVHGGIYVLNCGVKSISTNFEDQFVVTQYDQKIKYKKLCVPAYYLITQPSIGLELNPSSLVQKRISRGVCIVDKSIVEEHSQALIVMPREGSSSTLYFMQIGPPSCPTGRFAIYSFCWSQGETAKEDLSSSLHQILASLESPKIILEWYYNQQFVQSNDHSQISDVCMTDTPGGFIGYLEDIESAKSKFQHLYPEEEFMKSVIVPEKVDLEDDSEEDLFEDLEQELSSL